MNPTIQLVQLTVRFERQEKAQRHSFVTHRDGLPNEQSGYLPNLSNRIKQFFNPPRHQQCCECA